MIHHNDFIYYSAYFSIMIKFLIKPHSAAVVLSIKPCIFLPHDFQFCRILYWKPWIIRFRDFFESCQERKKSLPARRCSWRFQEFHQRTQRDCQSWLRIVQILTVKLLMQMEAYQLLIPNEAILMFLMPNKVFLYI